jgi:hypothetical protein
MGTVLLALRLQSGMLEVNTVKQDMANPYRRNVGSGMLNEWKAVCTHRSSLWFRAYEAKLGKPWTSINSKSLVTVRQFLEVLVVPSFESKY